MLSAASSQPVTVAYVRVNGLPLGLAGRARYAWYGAVPLPAHAWRALAGGHRTTVEVRLHEPVDAAAFPDRKALAEHCFRRVQEGLQAALHGRPAAPPPSPPAAHLDGTRAPSHNDGGE